MASIFIRSYYVCIFVALALGGCKTTFATGPDRLYSIAEETENLRRIGLPDFANTTKEYRNAYVTARLYSADIKYNEYYTYLTKENQLSQLGFDVVLQALSAGTTLAGDKGTKTALGAITGAVTGTRAAFDKDVMLTKTIQILQTQMETSRLQIRNKILSDLSKTPAEYPLASALSDLEDYYRAGTIAGALEDLSATTGKKSDDAKIAAGQKLPTE